jgi:hypothetical protein
MLCITGDWFCSTVRSFCSPKRGRTAAVQRILTIAFENKPRCSEDKSASRKARGVNNNLLIIKSSK